MSNFILIFMHILILHQICLGVYLFYHISFGLRRSSLSGPYSPIYFYRSLRFGYSPSLPVQSLYKALFIGPLSSFF